MIRLASVVLVAAAALTFVVMNTAQSQVKTGDPTPNFKDLPGVDGKNHSLSEYKKDVLVICITCNHCPVAIDYEDRIINFNKKYGTKVDFLAINVNNGESDKLPKMKERAAEKGFNFPYLYDESQVIARALGAKVTPHFFVFNKERKLIYQGAMDDSNNPTAAKTSFLADAVDAGLNGKEPSTTTTKARGCGVQYQSK